jgi:antitoxin ParD1/3/4
VSGLTRVVSAGDDASTSGIVREVWRDWKTKHAMRLQELGALRSDIDKGLADVAAGRVRHFDPAAVMARERRLLASRSRCV